MEIDGQEFTIDLGYDHWLKFFQWAPDRDLNPQYADIPDVPKAGALVAHRWRDGSWCMSGIEFDSESMRRVDPNGPKWAVESWEPLTLSPSLLCMACGDHGFIRGGKWVPA